MTAVFNRKNKGRFDGENKSILSIYHGTDAYLLEDELNELQWHQIESRARENRALYTDGIVSGFDIISATQGVPGYYISSRDGKPLKAFINGYLIAIGCNDANNFDDKLFLPFVANNDTTDKKYVYFLETWVESIGRNDTIRKFGGINTPIVTNDIADDRIGDETSRRLQLRWKLKISLTDDGGLSQALATNIIDGSDTNYAYQPMYNNINNTWYANIGLKTLQDGSIKSDGQMYAVPLFVLNVPANTTAPSLDILNTVGTALVKDNSVLKQMNDTFTTRQEVQSQIDDLKDPNGQINLILIAPDQSKWKVTVDNDGTLVTNLVSPPPTP